jgi:DNA repair protein RadA/Sms
MCPSCAKRRNYVRLRPEGEESLVVLREVSAGDVPRIPIPCWPEVENVLNGGFVVGTVIGLYGIPGIGKSTLALHLADALAALGPVGYLSSEQLVPHVKLTANRVGLQDSGVLVGYYTSVDEMEAAMEELPLRFVVVDSLQGCCEKGAETESAKRLVRAARTRGCAMLLVLHTTKEDTYSGPRAVEHEVDGMLELSMNENGPGLHLTVVNKYRYGPVGRHAAIGRAENGRLYDMRYGPF